MKVEKKHIIVLYGSKDGEKWTDLVAIAPERPYPSTMLFMWTLAFKHLKFKIKEVEGGNIEERKKDC